MQPLVHELVPAPQVLDLFDRFVDQPGCLLLESAMRVSTTGSHPLGRYSFLLAQPFDWIEQPVGAEAPLEPLRERLKHFGEHFQPCPSIPPFQGGYAGLLSYDLNQSLEKRIQRGCDEFQLPAVALAGYDTLIAWDHHTDQCWIVSTGLPETDQLVRQQRAVGRLQQWLMLIQAPAVDHSLPVTVKSPGKGVSIERAQYSVAGPVGLRSNFSAESYHAAVQKCIDYIHAGDVFQINLAQRLLFPAHQSSGQLYATLRDCNPAPFAGYFDVSQIADRSGVPFQIISASPERFVAVRDRIVETRPIKGTRRRTGVPLVDIYAREQLLASIKDRAENSMIVDLMRNDLSRCCLDDSIVVTQLCELEAYQSVFHLVSAVQGKLRPQADLIDLIQSVFPGGSITGAPKHRAMQIIGELEPHARGAYCGSLGYFGFDGAADFNILIRTITASEGWWQIPVGGGIVSHSKPRLEYEETWTKAASMLRAIEASREIATMVGR